MIHCTDKITSQQTQLLERNNAKINDKNSQKSINQSTLVDPSYSAPSSFIPNTEKESTDKKKKKAQKRRAKKPHNEEARNRRTSWYQNHGNFLCRTLLQDEAPSLEACTSLLLLLLLSSHLPSPIFSCALCVCLFLCLSTSLCLCLSLWKQNCTNIKIMQQQQANWKALKVSRVAADWASSFSLLLRLLTSLDWSLDCVVSARIK